MASARKLPAEWDQVLTRMNGELETALARTSACAADTEDWGQSVSRSRSDAYQEELNRRENLFSSLEKQLISITVMVEEADLELRASEEALRDLTGGGESLREKLDAWVRRAIG